MPPVLLALLVVGCDNVKWGGIEVKVDKPAAARETPESSAGDTAAAPPPLNLPVGPVLFHVRRTSGLGRATIEPVAEVVAAELKPVRAASVDRAAEYASAFNARYYQTDQAYTLFRSSARVGTFVVSSPIDEASGACPPLRADGQLELRARADTLSEFLAWPAGTRHGHDRLEPPPYRQDMPTLADVLATRGVQDRRIEGAWRIRAPADLRALDVGEGPLGFAATFMVRDSLGEGSPADSAGTVFLVADYAPERGFFPIYFDAAWYAPGSKRALRWLDAADLLGDSSPEWLLQAYGDSATWYEVVGRRGAELAVLWSSRDPACEVREPAAAETSG